MQQTIIDFGSLRHRITIQSPSTTQDAYGQPQQTYTTVARAWAGISALSGREQQQDGEFASQVSHAILTRYQPVAIAPGMRVVYGAHNYRVQAIDNLDQRNIWLRLLVLEINDTE